MSKLKYFIGAGVIVAVIGAAPLVVQNIIGKRAESTKVFLESHGFKQEILEKEGYFTTVRPFSLEIVNAQKVRDFLLDNLVAKNPQYKLLASNLKTQTAEEINEIFNGMQFKGEIINSNLIPMYVHMNVTLSALPHSMKEQLAQEKEAERVIQPLIDKGALGAFMVFDSDNKLRTFELKDIQEQMTIDAVTLNIDTQYHALHLEEKENAMNGTVDIAQQIFGLKQEGVEFLSQLQNFKYTFNYKDDFNNKANIDLLSYNFLLQTPDDKTQLSIGKIKASSSVEEKEKVLHVKADYTIDGIGFKEQNEELNVSKTFLKITVDGLRSDTIKKMQKDYNALLMEANTAPSDQVIIDDFVALVNNGFRLQASLNTQNVSGIIALKDVGLDINVSLPKNSYTDKESPLALLSLIDISSRVKVHKDDKITLEQLAGSAPEMNYGRAEGDFFAYDVVMKNGQVTVNGKAIQ